jgi:hypothetical protein
MEKKMPSNIIEIPSKELQYQIGQLTRKIIAHSVHVKLPKLSR